MFHVEVHAGYSSTSLAIWWNIRRLGYVFCLSIIEELSWWYSHPTFVFTDYVFVKKNKREKQDIFLNFGNITEGIVYETLVLPVRSGKTKFWK